MRGIHRLDRRMRAGRRAALATLMVASAWSLACERGMPLAPGADEPDASAHVIGLVEVTITGLGTEQATASALSAPDVAALERKRNAAGGSGAIALQSLDLPTNLDATGDGTIQLDPLATGSFTDGARDADGVRYLYATFRVRNAQTDGTAYDTPRQNLTFLAAANAGTLDETAISSLARFDGSAAGAGIAATILPTGSVMRPGGSSEIEPAAADVLQVLTEAEVADVLADAPAGVTTVFPYGFVVRNATTPASRILEESPAPGQYDGVVTFAFKVPLQASAGDDPYSISAVFLAVDDTETRVTESIEEQGSASVQAGADALSGAVSVTLLGNSATTVGGRGIRRVCTVRTAGTNPLAPAATLVDAGAGCMAGAVALPDHVIVVDTEAAPGGDGRSWATAFQFIQDALACARDEAGTGQACEGVSEIWVADGTYYADEGAAQTNDDASSRYEVVEGVSLYGGFAGDEYGRDQRDWREHVAVLDGDINGDGATSGNAGSILDFNAATITRATVVDGFTVRHAIGGGSLGPITCMALSAGRECSPTLRNLMVTENTTLDGAMTLIGSNGGVAAPLLDGITFADNSGYAGAIHVFSNAGTATPVIVRSTFTDNVGPVAGGVVLRHSNAGTVTADFHNVVFRNNIATSGSGGAVKVNDDLTARFYSAEFWDNTALFSGGAIYAGSDASVTLSGSTVAGNTSGASGAITIHSGTLTVYNSVIYGNTLAAIFGVTPLDVGIASYSLIEDGCPTAMIACTSIIDADPAFVSPLTGDLRLGGASPATDAGSNALLPADLFDFDGDGDTAERLPLDLAGGVRVVDWGGSGTGTVDMGAYERQ